MSSKKSKKNGTKLDPVKDANLIADMEAWDMEDAWEWDLNEIDEAQCDLRSYAEEVSEAIDKEKFREAFAAAQNALEQAERLVNLLGRNGYGDAPACTFRDDEDEDDEDEDGEDDESDAEDDPYGEDTFEDPDDA